MHCVRSSTLRVCVQVLIPKSVTSPASEQLSITFSSRYITDHYSKHYILCFYEHEIMDSTPIIESEDTHFPFLRLPRELRDLIYRYFLASTPIYPRDVLRVQQPLPPSGQVACVPQYPRSPSIGLLLTNHQLHEEAINMLWCHAHFVVVIKPHTFSASDKTWFWLIFGLGVTRLDMIRFEPRYHTSVRHIDLEISWNRISGWGRKCSLFGSLGDSLDAFPKLATISLRWILPDLVRRGLMAGESEWWYLVLLRPLLRLQLRRPEIRVEVQIPHVCHDMSKWLQGPQCWWSGN